MIILIEWFKAVWVNNKRFVVSIGVLFILLIVNYIYVDLQWVDTTLTSDGDNFHRTNEVNYKGSVLWVLYLIVDFFLGPIRWLFSFI